MSILRIISRSFEEPRVWLWAEWRMVIGPRIYFARCRASTSEAHNSNDLISSISLLVQMERYRLLFRHKVFPIGLSCLDVVVVGALSVISSIRASNCLLDFVCKSTSISFLPN